MSTIITLIIILLALIGHILRDQTIVLAFMMYIPLLPLGLWTIVVDLYQKGFGLPKRFSLSFIGLVLAIWGTISMIGINIPQVQAAANQTISLLHWNIKWAGLAKIYGQDLKNPKTMGEWPSIRDQLYQHNPDITILTDPPQVQAWLAQLKGIGNNMFTFFDTEYTGLAIISSWPLKFEHFINIRDGVGFSVVVTVNNKDLRFLLIDGNSNPRQLRKFLLKDIQQIVIDKDKKGQTVDFIIGDFNAVSRSIGFDPYYSMTGGYQLASKVAMIWRGTWPAFLPIFDIDHIWVSKKRFQILDVKTLAQKNIDHRGQLISIYANNSR
jgi:hypothetical protein